MHDHTAWLNRLEGGFSCNFRAYCVDDVIVVALID